MDKIRLRLRSIETRDVLKALTEIRNRFKLHRLDSTEQLLLLEEIIPLLDRTNTKIIDLSLSVLANMLLDGRVRQKFRSTGGIGKLVKIVNNLEDISLLRRGFRAISNASLDPRLCRSLHQQGLASILGNKLKSTTDEQMLIILLRCIRIVSDSSQYRNWLDEEGVYEAMGTLLVDKGSSEDDPAADQISRSKLEFDRTFLKSLAKLTHGATLEQAEKIMPAAPVISKFCSHSDREVWEHSLMVLVNLSQHSALRPSLGNAGAVGCLVEKFDSGELTVKETGHLITALCLYCRESVNRVKLRELGGCRVLVSVLTGDLDNLKHRVVNSLLQFMYDNHSLNVLMSVGLIPSLVNFIDIYNSNLKGKRICHKEETDQENTENQDSEEKEESQEESGDEKEVLENQETLVEVKNKEKEGNTPSSGPVFRINSPSYQAVQYELEQFLQMREVHGGGGSDRSPHGSGDRSPRVGEPVYSPASPVSLLQSPDRSPLQLSCGYSPDRSILTEGTSGMNSPISIDSPLSPGSPQPPTDFSPSSSPPYSPPEAGYTPVLISPSSPASSRDPSYSPIETFSEDEVEQEENLPKAVENSVSKPLAAASEAVETAAAAESSQHMNSSASQPAAVDGQSSTCSEGQTVLLTPKKKSKLTVHIPTAERFLSPVTSAAAPPPGKRLKTCSQSETPTYKYSATPLSSPLVQKAKLQDRERKVSESRDSDVMDPCEKKSPESERMDWILQILSRLTQAERPHEDLTSARTFRSLFTLMVGDPASLGRVSRILTRLSKNLYCLFPFLLQRHASWMHRKLEEFEGGPCCEECGGHQTNVNKTGREVSHNLTLLAETGYGEGEICHRLVMQTFSKQDKECIAISSAFLVKQRRKLHNILVNHDSLEILLDLIEESTDEDLLTDAVLSLSIVAAHIGIVAPNLTLLPELHTECKRSNLDGSDFDLILVLDDGSEIGASRDLLTQGSNVFEAMLEGGFVEASKSRVPIPMTSKAALNCVVHHLYSCCWCDVFHGLSAMDLLELLSLSDQFLLQDLNVRISHQIIRGCMQEEFLLRVYRSSLQKEYPVRCSESSLSACTISTVLVGEMTAVSRSRLVSSLISSELKSDFLDDVNKMIRKNLKKI